MRRWAEDELRREREGAAKAIEAAKNAAAAAAEMAAEVARDEARAAAFEEAQAQFAAESTVARGREDSARRVASEQLDKERAAADAARAEVTYNPVLSTTPAAVAEGAPLAGRAGAAP